MDILIVLIILLLVFGGTGFYTSRDGYQGPEVGGLLWILVVVVFIVLVIHLVSGAL